MVAPAGIEPSISGLKVRQTNHYPTGPFNSSGSIFKILNVWDLVPQLRERPRDYLPEEDPNTKQATEEHRTNKRDDHDDESGKREDYHISDAHV